MHHKDGVCIVLCFHNEEANLPHAVAGIVSQTHIHWRLVLVDDGSSDGSSHWAMEQSKKDPRIQVLRLWPQQGISAARNAGMNQCAHRYLAFCDADDVWMPYKLEKQLEALQTKNANICHTNTWYVDATTGFQSKPTRLPKHITYKRLLMGNPLGFSTLLLDKQSLRIPLFPILPAGIIHEDYAFLITLFKTQDEPNETEPGETKPGETKPGETKPGETEPGETKQDETSNCTPKIALVETPCVRIGLSAQGRAAQKGRALRSQAYILKHYAGISPIRIIVYLFSYFYLAMKKRRSATLIHMVKQGLVFAILLLCKLHLQAQTVSVGMPYFEERLRCLQLMQVLDSNVSFCNRPIDYRHGLSLNTLYFNDSTITPFDTAHYHGRHAFKKIRTYIQALPFVLKLKYDTHHPFGWSDGPMIPNVGAQYYVNAGFEIVSPFLDIRIAPELVKAQNKDFQNPPYRPGGIDLVDRFGTKPFQQLFWGQSHLRLNLGPISTGLSNENLWWGPGKKAAILMSNNAPGFAHGFISTNRPIKTPYARFEFQLVGGNLKPSGYSIPTTPTQGEWPYISAADNQVIPKEKLYDRAFSGYCITIQPILTPGLFLGFQRARLSDTVASKKTYLAVLSSKFAPKDEYYGSNRVENANQLVTISARYLFAASHAEIYVEWGREDWAWDIEDFLTQPEVSRAYLLGFAKVYPINSTKYLSFSGEFTNIQAPFVSYSRQKGYSFYTHSSVGYTHQGQVMGAGIGPGSNMQSIEFSANDGYTSKGVRIERLVHNIDQLYWRMEAWKLPNANPDKVDDSKNFVDICLTGFKQFFIHKAIVNYKLMVMKTYNYNWWYLSPKDGGKDGPFRYTGKNLWSWGAEVSWIQRF